MWLRHGGQLRCFEKTPGLFHPWNWTNTWDTRERSNQSDYSEYSDIFRGRTYHYCQVHHDRIAAECNPDYKYGTYLSYAGNPSFKSILCYIPGPPFPADVAVSPAVRPEAEFSRSALPNRRHFPGPNLPWEVMPTLHPCFADHYSLRNRLTNRYPPEFRSKFRRTLEQRVP